LGSKHGPSRRLYEASCSLRKSEHSHWRIVFVLLKLTWKPAMVLCVQDSTGKTSVWSAVECSSLVAESITGLNHWCMQYAVLWFLVYLSVINLAGKTKRHDTAVAILAPARLHCLCLQYENKGQDSHFSLSTITRSLISSLNFQIDRFSPQTLFLGLISF
jgi:hypothetical protein